MTSRATLSSGLGALLCPFACHTTQAPTALYCTLLRVKEYPSIKAQYACHMTACAWKGQVAELLSFVGGDTPVLLRFCRTIITSMRQHNRIAQT